MRLRALLLTPALTAMGILGLGSPVASAATLYTNSTHVAPVPVGTTATETSGVFSITTSGGVTWNSCSSSSLALSVTDNGATSRTVSANVIGGTYGPPCRNPMTGNFSPPWRLAITGTGTVSGTTTTWAAQVRGYSFTLLGGAYTGNLTSGVSASQPTTAGSPLSLVLNRASSISGPLISNALLNATYVPSGTAAAYSLG